MFMLHSFELNQIFCQPNHPILVSHAAVAVAVILFSNFCTHKVTASEICSL